MNSTVRVLLAGLGLSVVLACPAPMPKPDGGQTEECVVGTQGCACAVDNRCAKNSRGEQLVCMGGMCEAMTCVAGDRGCVCRSGDQCNGAADSCTAGFCIAAGCAPGTKDCTCLAGACDVGFTCLENAVCVDSTGFEGGACLANGRCNRGNRCDSSTQTCVFCTAGSAGCQCTTSNGCNSGLVCNTGQCLSSAQLPPASPQCFTPCRDSLDLIDGGSVQCTTDDVIAGCLPGKTCTNGSCLAAGETKPSCASDLECPFFQVCLTGGCYSNCSANADCSSGLGCVRKACRPSCSVSRGSAACGTGFACTANDGENGFCMPVGRTSSSSMAQTATPSGGLELPVERLELSNVKSSGTFQVLPKSSTTQDVTIRKLWHSVTDANGRVERVDAPLDTAGNFRDCDPVKNECPLWWLKLGVPGAAVVQTPTVALRLIPNCADTTRVADAGTLAACPVVRVENAGGVTAVRWDGAIEVATKDSRTQLSLSYVQRPDGQWTGSMYYIGTFNKTNLDQWIGRTNKADVSNVENGLIRRWGALRSGQLQGWQEFLAVLTATRTESWKFGLVAERCRRDNGNSTTVACYPYTNTSGVRVYVDNVNAAPIPSGVSELPVALNLQVSSTSPATFEGRVESAMALHYPGNPAIKFEFKASPADATSCAMGTGGSDCLIFLKENATGGSNQLISDIGGRYLPNGTCATGFVANQVPWLVPGFTVGTVADTTDTSGRARLRAECRDEELPFNKMASSKNGPLNQSLAGGNPVPDGRPRRRTLRFLDGALVNQSELFVLFEESFESFIAGQAPTTAYGYMLLKRAQANLTPDSFVGLRGPATMPVRNAPIPAGAQCDAALLTSINLPTTLTSAGDKTSAVRTFLRGSVGNSGFTAIPSNDPNNRIHYFCEDTGMFNGGKNDKGATPIKVACPVGSKVIFFNAGTRTDAQVADESCQNPGTDGRGTCQATLNLWRLNANVLVEENPLVECNVGPMGRPVFCDDNRNDLRAAKTFYLKGAVNTARTFLPLRSLIDAAFRYKTRFRSSSGGSLGFAPVQCVPNSDQVPYCYDPAQIEEARARIDCLINLYSDTAFVSGLGTTDATLRDELLRFLRQSFSEFPNSYSGFERLYAELLVMQGDEALTAAYASRFDLAATGGASFKGSAFEPNGIDLTGVAGAEMYRLYQATQYYQLALDRLYMLGPNMAVALTRTGVDGNFITPEMVTSYLERLIRAATQKSRALGEIARRYQNFNRPDLARRTVERGYVATYLESALISRQMLDIAAASSSASIPQIRVTIEKAQRNYRMALLDMREMYQQITDEQNFFGYAPDYIPFPAIDGSSVSSSNAFDTLLTLSRQRLDLAKTREQIALMAGRQGRVDAAQFQSDLTGIRNNYENQLANICGTFSGSDGRIYPAIRKYAPLNDITTQMGDPCGRMGSGDLHNAMGNVKDSTLKLKGVLLRNENILNDIQIEQTRIAQQCALNTTIADLQYQVAEKQATVSETVAKNRAYMALAQGIVSAVTSGIQVADCEIQCASSAAMGVTVAALGVAAAGSQLATDLVIANAEAEQRKYERDTMRIVANAPCQSAQIDGVAKIADLTNNTYEVQIEALRAEYGMRLAVSEVTRLFSQAQRLQAQQEEAEQLSINIQEAQNDPNVRIYQNDAIINADVSFRDALATAYRLTRVFEYYTSQSYAKKEQLFLIRMVTAGQYNLENYLLELENAFNTFEEEFGNPDVRVMALSLRDDILRIPYLKTTGTPLTEAERITMMRERLKDVKLLDSRGYLTLPFSTEVRSLSPLTRNHKVRHVEIDLQGSKMGDSVARVYLRMSGTGVVRNVTDSTDYYVFPERTGVVNASLLGSKVYDPEVYRNYRFRDRPLVNTLWELIVNQRDEVVNQDLDLQSLTDIRVLIYYSDFTTF